MKKPIPGLDASGRYDSQGRLYWSLNPDWSPARLVRHGNGSERRKKGSRFREVQQARQGARGDDLAARGMEPRQSSVFDGRDDADGG